MKPVMIVSEEVYLDYLASLLEGNKKQCLRIAENLAESNAEPIAIYTELFQKSLYQVGELWEKNRLCVAEEHLASSITEYVMSSIFPRFTKKEVTGKKAIITAVQKDFHIFGAKMAADIFELNGWDAYYLGPNTPIQSLIKIINQLRPSALAISATFYMNVLRLIETLETICSQDHDIDIYVGGQALNFGGLDLLRKFEGRLIYVKSIEDLDLLLKAEAE